LPRPTINTSSQAFSGKSSRVEPIGLESPQDSENIILSLTSGATRLLVPEPRRPSDGDQDSRYMEAGVIYHDLPDMPSLRELLAENRVLSAVWERDAGPPWRAVIAASLAVAITTAGGVLLPAGVLTHGLHVNALLGLMLLLGGIGLLVSLVVALRQ
jgi:hypothetical protein